MKPDKIFFSLSIAALLFTTSSAEFFEGLSHDGEMPEASSKVSQIPAKSDGKTITFTVKNELGARKAPSRNLKAKFDPYHDAADFRNFASASIVDGKLVRKKDVNGGTCFGISYFTHMWHNRIPFRILKGQRAKVYKSYKYEITTWDALTNDLSNAGKGENDGMNYVTFYITQQEKGDRPFFNSERMRENVNDYRLFSISNGPYKERVKVGSIAHHKDQRTASWTYWDASNKDKVEETVGTIVRRINAHGSMLFFWYKYKISDSWYVWDKVDWGHACLYYAVNEVEVDGSDGQKHKAWKIAYYDPNKTYRNRPANQGEGYGSYMLYFPHTKQVTFSKAAQSMYGMQQRSSVVDNDEVRMGYYELWEGHEVQDRIAKSHFFVSDVGQGRVLSAEEQARVEQKGKTKVENQR